LIEVAVPLSTMPFLLDDSLPLRLICTIAASASGGVGGAEEGNAGLANERSVLLKDRNPGETPAAGRRAAAM